MKHFSFPSIGQYHNAVKSIRDNCEYHGTPLPTVTFQGTVKLHGCFSANAQVTLANGERISISTVKPGMSVLTVDLKTNLVCSQTVKALVIQELPKDWIELTLEDGTILPCTEDQRFWTTNRGWVEAKNLLETDNILDEFSISSINMVHDTNNKPSS